MLLSQLKKSDLSFCQSSPQPAASSQQRRLCWAPAAPLHSRQGQATAPSAWHRRQALVCTLQRSSTMNQSVKKPALGFHSPLRGTELFLKPTETVRSESTWYGERRVPKQGSFEK